MPDTSDNTRHHVAVLGAAGRVGRAVTTALLSDEHSVTAVLRDPTCYELPLDPRLRIVQGDARHLRQLTPILRTVDSVVLAVTPFTAPPESFDGFDLNYYAKIVTEMDSNWHHPRRRLVAVGLTATLMLDSGDNVMDDPALFPPRLRPFAEAHSRELSALNTTSLGWAILTPPAGFGTQQEPEIEQGYQLIAEPVTRRQATAQLSHALYAQAVIAELINPTVHNKRVAVIPAAR
jgi:putative NADH-flavin reductase